MNVGHQIARDTGPEAAAAPDRPGWRPGRPAVLWLVTALLLSLVTWAVFAVPRHYQPVPAAWPLDPRFQALATAGGSADSATGWAIEGEPAGVTVRDGRLQLRNDDPGRSVGVRQVWRLDPDGPHAFRLTATVAGEVIAAQTPGPHLGEITLAADGEGAPQPGVLQRLVGLAGTRAQARYVELFTFPAGTERVELALRLRQVAGELTVGDLKLVALAERPWFAVARQLLRLAWLVVLPLGCWLLLRGIDHRPSGVALGVTGVASFVLLLMPATDRDESLGFLARRLPAALAGTEPLADLGHVVIFAALGCFLRLGRRADPWPAQLLLLVALGGLSEILQYLAVMRSSSLGDWAANAAGGLFGWLLATGWLAWRQEGQFATQRRSSTTVPPQAAKQCR